MTLVRYLELYRVTLNGDVVEVPAAEGDWRAPEFNRVTIGKESASFVGGTNWLRFEVRGTRSSLPMHSVMGLYAHGEPPHALPPQPRSATPPASLQPRTHWVHCDECARPPVLALNRFGRPELSIPHAARHAALPGARADGRRVHRHDCLPRPHLQPTGRGNHTSAVVPLCEQAGPNHASLTPALLCPPLPSSALLCSPLLSLRGRCLGVAQGTDETPGSWLGAVGEAMRCESPAVASERWAELSLASVLQGTLVFSQFYFYEPLHLSEVSPRMGPVAGGTRLLLAGSIFLNSWNMTCKVPQHVTIGGPGVAPPVHQAAIGQHVERYKCAADLTGHGWW